MAMKQSRLAARKEAASLLGVTFKYSDLFRLARIARLLGRQERGDLLRDIIQNRSQYTAFITILLTLIVLSSTSVLVLQYESQCASCWKKCQ
jgi:hypothetical protein